MALLLPSIQLVVANLAVRERGRISGYSMARPHLAERFREDVTNVWSVFTPLAVKHGAGTDANRERPQAASVTTAHHARGVYVRLGTGRRVRSPLRQSTWGRASPTSQRLPMSRTPQRRRSMSTP